MRENGIERPVVFHDPVRARIKHHPAGAAVLRSGCQEGAGLLIRPADKRDVAVAVGKVGSRGGVPFRRHLVRALDAPGRRVRDETVPEGVRRVSPQRKARGRLRLAVPGRKVTGPGDGALDDEIVDGGVVGPQHQLVGRSDDLDRPGPDVVRIGIARRLCRKPVVARALVGDEPEKRLAPSAGVHLHRHVAEHLDRDALAVVRGVSIETDVSVRLGDLSGAGELLARKPDDSRARHQRERIPAEVERTVREAHRAAAERRVALQRHVGKQPVVVGRLDGGDDCAARVRRARAADVEMARLARVPHLARHAEGRAAAHAHVARRAERVVRRLQHAALHVDRPRPARVGATQHERAKTGLHQLLAAGKRIRERLRRSLRHVDRARERAPGEQGRSEQDCHLHLTHNQLLMWRSWLRQRADGPRVRSSRAA